MEAAQEKGVKVSNVPTYGENAVAEHTFTLILSLSQSLRKAYLRAVKLFEEADQDVKTRWALYQYLTQLNF